MSGTYKFTEFTAYLKLMFGNNDTLREPIDYYGVWINTAYHRLTTRNRLWGLKKSFEFPELETVNTATTTTDGTQYISVPTDCLHVRDLYDKTNDRYLVNIPYREYLKYLDRFDTSAEGEPIEWVRAGTRLYLHPTPDTTGETIYIYYRKIPTALSGVLTTAIGPEWDEIILQQAFIIGKEWLGEYDKATALKKDLAESIAGLIGIYDLEEMASQPTHKPESQVTLEQGYK